MDVRESVLDNAGPSVRIYCLFSAVVGIRRQPAYSFLAVRIVGVAAGRCHQCQWGAGGARQGAVLDGRR